MTRTQLSGILPLLLACCVHAPGVFGQSPGYSGGYSVPPPNATQLPLYATRQSEFAIPFTVDRRIAQPVEVHLYMSVDQGRNWQLQSRQPPTTRQFQFRAQGDGEYWFASRTLDGAQRADTNATPQPELRVVVDTVSPQIEFAARPGEGGEVLTSWQLFDQNLVASSLRIEYQEEAGKPWKPVTVPLPQDDVVRTSYQGQTSWSPDTRSPTITIRAEVRDRAGNMAVANRRLLLPAQVAQQNTNGFPSNGRRSDPFARNRQPSEGAVPWPSDNQAAGNLAAGHWPSSGQPRFEPPGNSTAPLVQQSNQFGPPPTSMPRPEPRSMSPEATETSGFETPAGHVPAQQASTQFPTGANHNPANHNPANQVSSVDSGVPIDATALPEMADDQPFNPAMTTATDRSSGFPADRQNGVITSTAASMASPQDIASMLPAGERPQMTNSSRFHLEYDVDAVGPAGVAEVQLWATADAGRTWRLWGTDDDLQSPFEVAVEEDGIFGFHVVVVGKNGMSGRRPRTGDPADIWVGVDTTAPSADLTAATYGEGAETGKLLIQWRAADQYLDSRPITLSFSESTDGPWTVIVSSLPNTGQYSWPADPQLPSDVYLKLEVRDEAGNVVDVVTDESIQIDGLAPKARIRGVQPLQDLDREAFRVPRRR